MRIAVFSDVHGNFEALNTVMDLIDKEQVDRISRKRYQEKNGAVRLWEDGIHGEAATDAAKDVSSAISIRVMQSAEETLIQL